MRVGFVGLGNVGVPMATMIMRAGWPLSIYARRPKSLAPFTGTAAKPVSSLRELGASADLVGVCVATGDQVMEVLLGDNVLAGMEPGGVVAIHSTIHPDTCRLVADLAAARRVSVVDAPISAFPEHIYARKAVVMVGGSEPDFERCRPVFESFSDSVRWLGRLGSGQVTKLVNNLLVMVNLMMAHEAVELGVAMGADRERLLGVLQSASGRSHAMDLYADGYFDKPDALRHLHRLLRKDMDLAVGVADDAGGKVARLRDIAEDMLALMVDRSNG